MTLFSHAGSTYELPDLSPHFPYFPVDGKMSEEERACYLYDLDRHTKKVKTAFSDLVFDLQKNLEQTKDVKDIVCYLNYYDEHFKKLLHDCTNMAEVFEHIFSYSSFFDFEFIKRLTRKFASRKIKERLKKYRKMFQTYLKRRIVEFPDDAFEDANKSEKVYKVKTDRVFADLTGEDLQKLQYEMNKIFDNKFLRILRVEEGCVQLTFRGFEEDEFSITTKQQQALRNVDVLGIKYGEYFVDIEKGFVKESEKFGELYSSRDTVSNNRRRGSRIT